MAKSKANREQKNQVPLLIIVLGAVALIAIVMLMVLPALGDKAELRSEVDTAESRAAAKQAQLEALSGEQTFAEMAAEARLVDQFFPFFDTTVVSDPVAEINLVYPPRVEQASAAAGFSPEEVTVSWPAETHTTSAPESVGAVKLAVTVRGGTDAPDRFLSALRDHGMLATVIGTSVTQVVVEQAEEGGTVYAAADEADANLVQADLRSYTMQILLWYTTTAPVDLTVTGR